ncbi:endonuclease/exonuclease/phosphatase family protein [Nocardia alba]|uniref:Endonuclease/exonuclease/phosphatase (EEP) superfamily protein YafD n=1 Tax=Nocardia alba TaxID=225051 RepID=A0A4R1FGJ1_9NOCA|nr:endonuclease/exonuclease/phosphatase family protein [Nocardia alba]TCJ93443.1 endonuclease/exonuclease/phosphatase (EEP) superfamily protein YafD [Nocardia alba]
MMRKRVERALLVLGWGAVVAAVAGIVLHVVDWRQKSMVLLASGAMWLMLGAVVGLVLLLLARGWRSSGAAVLVLAGAAWLVVPSYIPEARAADGPELVVMQSNILFGQADPHAVVGAVRDNNVDVLTVEELTVDSITGLRGAGLEERLPYSYLEPARSGGGGTGIYSRYPLRDTRKYDGFIMSNISATMQHPQRGPMSVFAFHPIPPNLDFGAWSAEMRRIDEILAASSAPAIVGADFNATHDHSAYRALLDGAFASAADQTGDGVLLTYPADRRWGPVLGIDHILVAGGVAEQIRTLTIPGSDHRAVLATIRMDL